MPWGAVGTASLFGLSVSSIVTGWSGYITLLGIIVPNWTVVICALAIVLLHWLHAGARLQTNTKVSLLLAAYGIVHTVLFIYSIITYGGSRIGIGAVITMVSFIALFRSVRKGPSSLAAPAQSPPGQGPPGQSSPSPNASSLHSATQQLPDQDA